MVPPGRVDAIVADGLTKYVTTRTKARDRKFARCLPPRSKRVQHPIVENVSFTVGYGECVALLGANGAGKSTLIKMLTGVLTPSRGSVLINGRVPYKERKANARAVGAVFGQRTQLWWDLTPKQSFELLRDIYKVSPGRYRQQLEHFERILDGFSYWNTPVRNLSLGQRVRCDLAATMLHDPLIVFLDEPTIGMDVIAKEETRTFLRRQVAEFGRTVLLTTHDMGEVDRLCKRVLLIDAGRLGFDGLLQDLRQRFGGATRVKAEFSEPVIAPVVLGSRTIVSEGLKAIFEVDEASSTEDVVRSLISSFPVANLSVEEIDLEGVMRSIFDGLRTGDAAMRPT